MPEIPLDLRRIRKEYPVLEPVPSTIGTLTIMTGSIQYFDSIKEYYESVISQNPSLRDAISPTINWIEQTKNITIQGRKTLLLEKASDLYAYEKIVKDYEMLISNPKTEEPDIQAYFTRHPILIEPITKKLIPKQSFGGEEYPDFVAILANGKHILIEIEKPSKRIYVKSGRQSADFSAAEQQIQDYLRWANENMDYLRKPERNVPLPHITVENTSGLLIYGMKKDLRPKEISRFERKKYESKNYEIKAFDEVLWENQQVLKSLNALRNS